MNKEPKIPYDDGLGKAIQNEVFKIQGLIYSMNDSVDEADLNSYTMRVFQGIMQLRNLNFCRIRQEEMKRGNNG